MCHQHDLTRIKGIGPARQHWLQTTLGVHTFQALAQLAPEDVVQRLRVARQIVPRQTVDEWIAQARLLAEALPAYGGNGWQAVASFVVEIQRGDEGVRTVVQHIETDRNGVWPGMEPERLCDWLVAQVAAEVAVGATVEVTAVSPSPPATLPVIQQVQVFQPVTAAVPLMAGYDKRPLPGLIQSAEPFRLLAILATSEPCAGQVHFRVRNLVSGEKVSLGNGRLQPHTPTTHAAHLPTATLPPGLYHLYALAQIDGCPPIHLELPFVQVAPA